MKARNAHRIIGLVLLVPLIGWVVTGVIFFVKPGYAGAYESLRPKAYPLAESLTVVPEGNWLEYRYVRTILGPHLLVRDAEGWQQVDPGTMEPRPLPGMEGIRSLVEDAIAGNPSRYGSVDRVDGREIITTTNVRITLGWNDLSFSQRGEDTELIDAIYKIHYLQWTGIGAVDKFVGGAGLLLLALLSFLGFRLAFRR
jgi:hypothetical protein